jgi:hypothetical protein
MRLFLPALGLVVLVPCVGCDDSSCDAARVEMTSDIHAICGEAPYAESPFCSVCVANNYYSISDMCTCQPLTLNSSQCYYATGTSAMEAIRFDIDQANATCNGRTWPLLPCYAPDSGSCAAGTSTDASIPSTDGGFGDVEGTSEVGAVGDAADQ